jgi:hypothetical protein
LLQLLPPPQSVRARIPCPNPISHRQLFVNLSQRFFNARSTFRKINLQKYYQLASPVDQLTSFVQTIFQNPPIPFNPANQTLKGWMVYCLRDRGLLVDTVVTGADLKVKSKVGEVKFNVSDGQGECDPSMAWIVLQAGGKTAQVIPAQT